MTRSPVSMLKSRRSAPISVVLRSPLGAADPCELARDPVFDPIQAAAHGADELQPDVLLFVGLGIHDLL